MLITLLLACNGGDTTITDGPTDPLATADELTGLTVTPSQLVPSVFQVAWTAPGTGTSWVEFGLSAPGERATPEVVATTATHAVRLAGLKAGRTYQYRAITRLDTGTVLESPVGQIVVPAAPMVPTVVTSTPEATVPDGYLVTTFIEDHGGWVVILDGDGDLVWWYDTGHAGTPPADMAPFVPPTWDGGTMPVTSRFDPATRSVLVQFSDTNRSVDVATLRRIPLDAMVAGDMVTTRTPLGHHDFVLNSEAGMVGFLAYETADLDGTVWASDAIIESAEGTLSASGGNRKLVWSWLTGFDEPPVLFDGLQEAFLVENLADLEWTHSNSLMYDEDAGSYFVLSKFLDALAKIDRTTGELEWVLGGPYSDFALPNGDPVWTGLDATALWSHGHMSHLWYDAASLTGGFVMFDNGYYHPAKSGSEPGWSRVAEYSFDEIAMTVEEVWHYDEPGGGFTPLMGDARKLPSGNYLIGWSSLRRIEEVAPDGTVRWRLDPPKGSITGRVSWYDEVFPERP